MPFFTPEPDQTSMRGTSAGLPAEPPIDPSAIMDAALRQNNSVVSTIHAIRNSHYYAPEDGHNSLDLVRGTIYEQRYLDRFAGSRSQAEDRHIMAAIDSERADQRILEGSGKAGVVAGFVAGTFDPTLALPSGVAIQAGKDGVTFAKAAMQVGKAALVQSTVQEGILTATQQTRTVEENLLNVGSATLLSAFIGGAAAKLLSPVEHAAAVAKLDLDRLEMNAHAGNGVPFAEELRRRMGLTEEAAPAPTAANANLPLARAAGAAATDIRELELVPTGLKLEKFRDNPQSRVFNSASPSARRAMADLAESPLEFKENLEGVPTTAGPALDRIARMAIDKTRVAVSDKLEELWKQLRFGSAEEAPFAPRIRDNVAGFLGRNAETDAPTFEQFKAMVSEAGLYNDKHAIPQVEQAAQFIRQQVFEPWKERAIKAGLLPENVDVKTADSYMQRIYNKQVIAAKRPEFVNVVQSWLKSDQETKAAAQDRIKMHNRLLQDSKERLAKLEGKAGKEADYALAKQQHDAIRADVEKEIAAWEGKTTAEAKSALKAREKHDAARTELSKQKQPRLESADNAVDRAVRDILESDRAISDAELRDRAHEITERILGSPDGRLPYAEKMGEPIGAPDARGPLAAREFNIPDTAIREFLEQDIEQIANTHLRTMVPDVLLTERFGDINMTEAFRKIEDDYAALIDQTKSLKEREKLDARRRTDIRDLAGVRDRVRGVFGVDVFNSMRGMARAAQAVKNANIPLSMGMAAVSSLPDLAGPIFRWGLGTVFKDAWAPFANSLATNRELTGEAARQFRAMGLGVDRLTAQRHRALTDIMDGYRPNSRLERTLQWGADKFQLVNMLGHWTDAGKIIAATVASQEFFRAAEAWAKGTATQKQVRALAASGIDIHMAEKIAKQYRESGNIIDGVHLPNTEAWTDAAAREAFEGAVHREADIAIVTPGQEKPLLLSNPVLNVLFQFKSFTAASTQRILIANLQRRDAQVLQGLMFSMGLGMTSYKLNSMLGGQPSSDRPQDWVKEGLSRGSVLGWLEEGNALASKATRGGVDIHRLYGADKPLSRYAGRSVVDQLLGPTAGKIDSITKITGAAGSAALGKGEWNAGDTTAVRKLIAFQNLWYLRGLFNQVEAGVNEHFGVPPKPEPKKQP